MTLVVPSITKTRSKRQRPQAEQLAPFLISVFDLPQFFATATVDHFNERHARGELMLEFEAKNVVLQSSNALFEHILQFHDAELSFEDMFEAALAWMPASSYMGQRTRLGRLLTHLATNKPIVEQREMASVLNRLATDGVPSELLDEFLKALLAGLGRLAVASTSAMSKHGALLTIDERLLAIGNAFVEAHTPRKTDRYLRLLCKRGRATLPARVDSVEAADDTEDVRKVLRVDAALTKLIADDSGHVTIRGKRPRLAILSQ